jgi:hypothetical protein
MSASILSYRRKLSVSYDDIVDLADSCFRLSDLAVENIETRQTPADSLRPVQIILLANLHKATDSLISAVKLVDAGLVGDAESTVRKLVEVEINMKFLHDDSEVRQRQYWAYIIYSKKRMAESIVADKRYNEPLRRAANGHLPELSREFEKIKQFIARTKKGKINTESWSGLSLSEMAEKAGLTHEYMYCYRVLCVPTHANVLDMERFVDLDTLRFGTNYRSDTALAVIIEACRCHLIIMDLVITCFSLQLHESHKLIGERLESFKGDPRLPNWPGAL